MKVAELYRAALAEIAADEALLTLSRRLVAIEEDDAPGLEAIMLAWQHIQVTEAMPRRA